MSKTDNDRRALCKLVAGVVGGAGIVNFFNGCRTPLQRRLSRDYRTPSLLEVIERNGFELSNSNVDSIHEAQLVIFGENHVNTGDELSKILRALHISDNDRILIEHTAPMRATPKAFWEKESYVYASREEFFSRLTYRNKGLLVGVDAKRGVKNRRLYAVVQRPILAIVKDKTLKGIGLHPFEEWLVYKDLRLYNAKASVQKKIMSIDHYLASNPTLEEVMEENDLDIAANVVGEVKTIKAGGKCYMVFGQGHFKNGIIIRDLHEQGIAYMYFSPAESKLSKEEALQERLRFFQSWTLPEYVKQRVACEGSPNYIPPKKGKK